MTTLAILGRGSSVTTFSEYSSQFPRIYIVNTFNNEIEAIGQEHFEGKNLVHVQGPAYNHNLDCYDLFATVDILKNNNDMTPVMMQRGYPATTPWDALLTGEPKNHQALISKLDSEHEQKVIEWKKQRPKISGRWWPTIGMFAIEYALVVDKPDELYLFGFDFYESNYVHKEIKEYKNTPTLASMMRYHLEALIAEFSHVTFHIITASKTFRPQYPNCGIRCTVEPEPDSKISLDILS